MLWNVSVRFRWPSLLDLSHCLARRQRSIWNRSTSSCKSCGRCTNINSCLLSLFLVASSFCGPSVWTSAPSLASPVVLCRSDYSPLSSTSSKWAAGDTKLRKHRLKTHPDQGFYLPGTRWQNKSTHKGGLCACVCLWVCGWVFVCINWLLGPLRHCLEVSFKAIAPFLTKISHNRRIFFCVCGLKKSFWQSFLHSSNNFC